MERTGKAKLEDILLFLLNDDSGKMDERKVEPGKWGEKAFDTMPNNSWIVIKCPQSNRTHVLCDFCDDDERLAGPYSLSLTVRELIEHTQSTIRARRRACSDDNVLRKAHLEPRFCHRKEEKEQREECSSVNPTLSRSVVQPGYIELWCLLLLIIQC
jgi:hypothetical protein